MCLLFVSLWIMNNYTCIETRFNGTFNNCYGGKKNPISPKSWLDHKHCVEFYSNSLSIVMFSNNLLKIVII